MVNILSCCCVAVQALFARLAIQNAAIWWMYSKEHIQDNQCIAKQKYATNTWAEQKGWTPSANVTHGSYAHHRIHKPRVSPHSYGLNEQF